MQKSSRSFGWILAVAAGLALSACGGGEGGGIRSDDFFAAPMPKPVLAPNPDPATMSNNGTSAGIWTGKASNGRTVNALVQADGSYWVLYSTAADPNVIDGAVQGNATSKDGTFTSSNARDFNIAGGVILDASVSALYVPRVSFNGDVTYASGNRTSFTGAYNPIYDKTASLADLAGTYTGTAAVVAATETTTLTISANGDVAGSSASGCKFKGTAAAIPEGATFSLSITFGGGVCANGTDTIAGVGLLDTDNGNLYGLGINPSRSNGMIFTGKKS